MTDKTKLDEIKNPAKIWVTIKDDSNHTYGAFYDADGITTATLIDYRIVNNVETTSISSYETSKIISQWGVDAHSVEWKSNDFTDFHSRFNSISNPRPYMYYSTCDTVSVDNVNITQSTNITVSFIPSKNKYEISRSRTISDNDAVALWKLFVEYIKATPGEVEVNF